MNTEHQKTNRREQEDPPGLGEESHERGEQDATIEVGSIELLASSQEQNLS